MDLIKCPGCVHYRGNGVCNSTACRFTPAQAVTDNVTAPQINVSKMKPIGIVRGIDDLGRVCIPREYREMMFTHSTTAVEFQLYEDECGGLVIMLKKH